MQGGPPVRKWIALSVVVVAVLGLVSGASAQIIKPKATVTSPEGKSIEEICKLAYADKAQPIINNVGQDYNHIHFWQWMKKGGGGKKLPGTIQKLVDGAGGYDKVRNDFIENGKTFETLKIESQ